MARIRTLKPDFFKHPELCELPVVARYFFAGLWCQADRDGRLKDRPRVLKLEIAPWDDIDPEMVLAELAKAGFIQRYEVDGEQYISIRHFTKHQRPHPKEPKSEIPPPTKPPRLVAVEKNGETRPDAEINGTPTKQDPAVEKNGEPGGLLTMDYGGKAGGGILMHDPPPPPPAPPAKERESPPDPLSGALVAYLTETWGISKPADIATAWRKKWGGLDLLSEAKKARAYEQETGKTHDDPPSFLRGWMRRAAERKGNGVPATPIKTARERAEETRRKADERDRQFREEQARSTDARALVHRLWLWQRWPKEFPQYAPSPEAGTA